MNVGTETHPHGWAILLQVLGALALIVVAIVAVSVLFHWATVLVGKLLPLLVIGAVLYVLLRLVLDAGQEA